MIDLAENTTTTETGCLLWTGERNWQGYGRLYVNRSQLAAHRAVYEQLVGPIPERRSWPC